MTIGYYERLGKNVTVTEKRARNLLQQVRILKYEVHTYSTALHSLLAAIGGSGVLAATVQVQAQLPRKKGKKSLQKKRNETASGILITYRKLAEGPA